jgi:RimJ/RimL family protein N-acetyltransferase
MAPADAEAAVPPDPARPEPRLAGRLTFLRPAEREDIPIFVRWLSDARTAKYLALRSPLSRALEERWFEDMLEHHGRDRWHFVICRSVDGRPVGTIGLEEVDLTNGSAAVGIAIGDPVDTSQGYGSDALTVALDFGFGELRLERVWLDVYDFNDRARHVYERLGFVHEATFRRALFRSGRHHDVHRLAILRDEWRSDRTTGTA